MITDRKVAMACERLGENVSIRNVRELLGGGSLRDIAPRVRAWKALEPGILAAGTDLANMLLALGAWEKRFLSLMDDRLKELRRLENSVGWREASVELLEIRNELRRHSNTYGSLGRIQEHRFAHLDHILAKLEEIAHHLERPSVRQPKKHGGTSRGT